jgi:hypothetical protein
MPFYRIDCSVTVPATFRVEADSPEEARQLAETYTTTKTPGVWLEIDHSQWFDLTLDNDDLPEEEKD